MLLSTQRFALALVVVCGSWMGVATSRAANIWDGGGGNDDWATALNWDDDTVPVNDGSADITFGTGFASGTSIDTGVDRDINSLTINTTTAFSLDNNTLTLQSGNFTRTGSGDKDINSNLELAASGIWNVSAGNETRINGIVSQTGGTQGITYNGGGRLWMQNANTFGGEFTLNDNGLLWINDDAGLGTGKFVWNNGRVLGAATMANALQLGSGNHVVSGVTVINGAVDALTSDQVFTGSGSLTLNSNVTESGSRSITNATRLYLLGDVTVSGGISTSAGDLRLGGNNSITGTVTISGGDLRYGSSTALGTATLEIDGGRILNLGGPQTLANDIEINNSFLYGVGISTFTGAVTLNATPVMTPNNAGSDGLVFNGDIGDGGGSFGLTSAGGTQGVTLGGNNTYTGTTTVTSGDLTLNGSLATADIVVASGATFEGIGTINFTDGDLIDLDGIMNAGSMTFDLTALTTNNVTLVDYSGGGTFNGPGSLNDLLSAGSLAQAWSLTDTGSQIVAEFPVPEPSSLLLLGIGGIGVLRRGQRRRIKG